MKSSPLKTVHRIKWSNTMDPREQPAILHKHLFVTDMLQPFTQIPVTSACMLIVWVTLHTARGHTGPVASFSPSSPGSSPCPSSQISPSYFCSDTLTEKDRSGLEYLLFWCKLKCYFLGQRIIKHKLIELYQKKNTCNFTQIRNKRDLKFHQIHRSPFNK